VVHAGERRRLCRANSNQSEQFRSDLGVVGGHCAGLPRALFRYRNVRSFRPARDLRIPWPHGPRARQCHCDKSGREDRAHDGICFEPSIECALILRGQPAIVKTYAVLSHVTPLRLVEPLQGNGSRVVPGSANGCDPLRTSTRRFRRQAATGRAPHSLRPG